MLRLSIAYSYELKMNDLILFVISYSLVYSTLL